MEDVGRCGGTTPEHERAWSEGAAVHASPRRCGILVAGVLLVVGCFSDERPPAGDGSTSTGSTSAASSSTGELPALVTWTATGVAETTDEDASETMDEDTVSGACEEGTRECRDGIPHRCEGGAWVEEEACAGRTPVCSGGECSPVVLVGGLVGTSVSDAPRTPARLVSHGFESAPTRCKRVDDEVICLTGWIRP